MTTSLELQQAERLCTDAHAHLEAGRFREAEELLSRAKLLAPRSAIVHYRLALLYSDTGRPALAIEAIETSLGLDDSNAKAHNNRGSALQQLGRLADAEGAFERALELDPDLDAPYINLGHLLEQRGAKAQAVAIYERAIARGLDREMFKQFRAAASGQNTRASPESWVRATFDNFAPMFDARLRTLDYRVPQELAQRLSARTASLLDILDLGCGTGQCGLAIAKCKRSLIGVDLSRKMIRHAANHGIYDQLHVAEVHAFLRASAAQCYDAVISADVFIYIGALDEFFRETARVLRPGGWFAFSTEEETDNDFALLATGRYAQSHTYIQRLAARDFDILVADPAIIRMESGNPLRGRLYLLRLRSPG